MSRVFWIGVGAVGGVIAYRKSLLAAQRARELGPLGTAQVVAQTTGRAATGAANGLGRLRDAQARRAGRLLIGTAEDVTGPVGLNEPDPIPADWVPVGPAFPEGVATPADAIHPQGVRS